MSANLVARAAAAAGREIANEAPHEPAPAQHDADAPDAPDAPDAFEPDVDDADLTSDPEKVDVLTAWLRVMGEVRVIRKNQRFDGGRAGKFNFRGVDAVYNAFGPICRKHGVSVWPFRTSAEYRDIPTASGGSMRECTVTVTFRVYGPNKDFLEAQTMGEATDSGSRSTPKAQSVALRVLMLTGGMVPTEGDPDGDAVERVQAPVCTARDYLDEILKPHTSRQRMAQINYEIKQAGLAGSIVQNETGGDEALGDLLFRVGKERFEQGGDQ